MALIAMAVHDTEENGRSSLTDRTIDSLMSTVDLTEHRLIIIDNASCVETKRILGYNESLYEVITLPENIGTAKAINIAWKQRKPGEHCIKIDNDVVIHREGWVEEMEEAIARDQGIGQVGLKRKDLWESPDNPISDRRSTLYMLPHQPGERWIVVEKSKHIMGTCVMHNSALLDKVGYLYQPSLYGFDDVLMSWRSNLSGFYNCFLPHIHIDHIDPGGTDYVKWKQDEAGKYGRQVSDIVDEYISGARPLYYE
jgi:GT2 family glycosyltransferase